MGRLGLPPHRQSSRHDASRHDVRGVYAIKNRFYYIRSYSIRNRKIIVKGNISSIPAKISDEFYRVSLRTRLRRQRPRWLCNPDWSARASQIESAL